jgi:glycosyltransferase involved in cell wall biosynthesis
MARPLSIYSFIPRNHTASQYYRIQVLCETAAELGLPVQSKIDTDLAGIDPQERIEALTRSDIVLLYQPIGADSLKHVQTAQSLMPYKIEGEWQHGPAIVVESDDNLFNVTPYNPAFRSLGIRDQNGNDIPNGAVVGDMQEGKKRLLWHEGECRKEWGCEPGCKKGVSFAANKQHLESYRRILTTCDAFTCSTPAVLEAVSKEVNLTRTRIFPNCVRFDQYPKLELRQDPDRVNILWQGGGAHYEDWFPLRDALGSITRRYPEVHWIIWGALYQWAMELIPPDRYTFIPWCAYPEYKLRRVMINDDINLAPLEENRFNSSRSAIKFYEATVSHKPAATLAQRSGAYKDEMIDGETGLLFSDPREFETKLASLIENRAERRRLAQNGKDWVNENRNAFREVPKHIQYLEQVRDEVRRDRPHMSDSAWKVFEDEAKKEQEEAESGALQLQPQAG